jgi:hypothetical protein
MLAAFRLPLWARQQRIGDFLISPAFLATFR